MTNEELQAEVDRLRRVILNIQNRTMKAMGAVLPGTLSGSEAQAARVKVLEEALRESMDRCRCGSGDPVCDVCFRARAALLPAPTPQAPAPAPTGSEGAAAAEAVPAHFLCRNCGETADKHHAFNPRPANEQPCVSCGSICGTHTPWCPKWPVAANNPAAAPSRGEGEPTSPLAAIADGLRSGRKVLRDATDKDRELARIDRLEGGGAAVGVVEPASPPQPPAGQPPCADCGTTERDRSACPCCGKVVCQGCAEREGAPCCDGTPPQPKEKP